MTTAYTSLLGLALPVTGELSGTWGDTVNDYITQYLDASVAGTQTISGSQTAVTLSKTTNASLSQAGSGATGSSQYNVINCTGNPASMLTVTVPAASKTYVVVNATSTNQDVKIVGAGPTTGVTLVAGEKAIIAWNGSDFIKIATSTADGVTTLSFGSTGLTPSTATSGAVTVAGTLVAANGGTGQSSYTTGDLLYATGSTALSKLGIGTNGQILTSTGTAPQWSTLSGVAVTTFSAGTTGFTPSSATSGAITLAGTLATTNGGTGLTSFTANRVFYSSSTSAIGSSANLTFDGTTLTANALTTTSTVTINGGTANGVAYLNGSKVLTTGSALSFDGTTFNVSATYAQIKQTATGSDALLDMYGQSATTGAQIRSFGSDSSAQYLIFKNGNTEGMRLTSTGLGIGTSSPGYRLDVQTTATGTAAGDNTAIYLASQASGRDVNIRMGDGVNASARLGYLSGNMYFYTNAAERMRLNLSGNLGIGTSSPTRRLEVSTVGVPQLRLTSTSSNTGIELLTSPTTFNWFVGAQYNVSNAFEITPSTAVNGTTFSTPALVVTSGGNVGIGTSSPSAILHTKTSGGEGLRIQGTATNAFIRFTDATNTSTAYIGQDTTFSIVNQANTDMRFNTNNTEQMRLTASGNLGIGTSSPNISAGSGKALTISSVFTRSRLEFQNTAGDTAGNVVGTISFFNGSNLVSSITGGSNTGSATSGYLDFNSSGGSMRLDSAGNLGIGTTSPSSFAGYTTVSVNNATNGGIYNILVNGTETARLQAFSGAFTVAAKGASTNLLFETNGSERARIDTSGNLGIGTNSPGSYNSSARQLVIANASTSTGMTIRAGGGGAANIVFSNAEDTGVDGLIQYDIGSNYLRFDTNGSERARITSVGNLSLGGTADRGTTVGTNAIQIFNGTAPAGTLTNGVSLYSQSGDLRFMDAAGNAYPVGFRNIPQSGSAKTGSYTLATTDVGEYIQVGSGGSITIPDATFATGDVVSVFNNTTGNITITCSITTAYIAGTDSDKATMTLATRGVATILFISSTVCVVTGNVT